MITYDIKKPENEYPGLYTHKSGLVVLMTEPGKGVVIGTDVRFHVGYYGTDWREDEFTPFRGKITLSNEPINNDKFWVTK